MFTYCITDGSGSAKIGRAADVKRRLAELQTGNPRKLAIVAVLDGDHEAELHQEFSEHRTAGEWFSCVEQIKAEFSIRQLALDRQHREHEKKWGVQRDDVGCAVFGLEYDFLNRTGRIRLPELNCTSFSGVIRLFEQIDPNVTRIATIAGSEPDTIYEKRMGEWKAFLPKPSAPVVCE